MSGKFHPIMEIMKIKLLFKLKKKKKVLTIQSKQYSLSLSLHPSVPSTAPDQRFSPPLLCLAVLSAQGVSRTTLMCGDT